MKHFTFFLLAISACFATSELHAQAGACPYPVIYVHGWNGNQDSWKPSYDESSFKAIWGGGTLPNEKIFWAMPNATDTHGYYQDCCCPLVFGACLCGQCTYLDEDNRNDNINGPNGTWQGTGSGADDVQWIFADEDNVLQSGCVYAINFNTGKNANNTIRRDPGLLDDHTAPCDDCSENNEAAILKQGYALKQAIAAVLAANPTKKKVILVGHSMGGLCIREYLQRTTSGGAHRWWVDPSSPDGHKVARVLTAGTPHRGSNSFESVFGRQSNPEGDDAHPEEEDIHRNTFPDLNSEAVRDLRYKYTAWFGSDIAGLYLYGGNETYMADGTYWSEDVDCDGDDTSPSVIGINQAGSPVWDGTTDNTAMPLPTNIKYTWFVTNQIGGALSTCKYQNYGCAGDGVVDDERQWIYSGGSGKTEDFVDGLSVSVPFDGVANRLSDRITSENRVFHTSQPEDIDYHVHGIDEGDYPYFAWDINLGTKYAGIVQLPADRRPADGNRTANQDKDWYVFEVPSNTRGIKVTVRPNSSRAGRIDFYDNPATYETGNSTNFKTFPSGTATDQVLKAVGCFAAGNKYYVRVQHDGIVRNDWKNPFTIKVETFNVDIPTAIGVYTATNETRDGSGWTHYWKDAAAAPATTNDLLLLSIKKDATVNIPTNAVIHGVSGDIATAVDLSTAAYRPTPNWYVMDRYWYVSPTTQPGASGVNVRFYYTDTDYNAVANAANSNGGSVTDHADLLFYKFTTASGIDPNPATGHLGAVLGDALYPSFINDVCVADNYAEMNVSSFSGGGGGGGGGLPVELTRFEGKRVDNSILLEWATAYERNSDKFVIEKATKDLRFNPIGEVSAKGNSSSLVNYQFVDTNPSEGNNYYRLVQFDRDGTSSSSKVASVRYSNMKGISIDGLRPIPAKESVTATVTADAFGKSFVTVYDALGRKVMEFQNDLHEGQNDIDIDIAALAKGMYVVQVTRESDSLSAIKKFIKD
jgi:pimeloyl-ACP methyl ester carboxylesterase